MVLLVGLSNNPMYQRSSKRVRFVSPGASSLVEESVNSSTEASKSHWVYSVAPHQYSRAPYKQFHSSMPTVSNLREAEGGGGGRHS